MCTTKCPKWLYFVQLSWIDSVPVLFDACNKAVKAFTAGPFHSMLVYDLLLPRFKL